MALRGVRIISLLLLRLGDGLSFRCAGFFFAGIRVGAFAARALPLCGAAVTFFAAAKKVTKESRFQPPVPARITLRHSFFELSHSDAPLRSKLAAGTRGVNDCTQLGTFGRPVLCAFAAGLIAAVCVPNCVWGFRAVRG